MRCWAGAEQYPAASVTSQCDGWVGCRSRGTMTLGLPVRAASATSGAAATLVVASGRSPRLPPCLPTSLLPQHIRLCDDVAHNTAPAFRTVPRSVTWSAPLLHAARGCSAPCCTASAHHAIHCRSSPCCATFIMLHVIVTHHAGERCSTLQRAIVRVILHYITKLQRIMLH